VNFPVQGKKATQAVARLIERSGTPIDYLRVIKLVYLADRESVIQRGLPIVGGHYYSMRKGPVISEVMNFVTEQNAPDWKDVISPRYGNEIRLQRHPDFGALSQAEMEILDEVVRAHSSRTTEELVEWCHQNCTEYEKVESRDRKPITVESILRAIGKPASLIRRVVKEAEHLAEMDRLLA
jgi:uncharacterized phage-associated protein